MPPDQDGGTALPDPARITVRRRIEWIDTDAAGIWHWTTAFRLVEAAEAALHGALGIADRTFGFTPRVGVSADFHSRLRFDDAVDVTLTVDAVGRSSLRYTFAVEGAAGTAVTGRVTVCFVDGERAAPWPDDLRTALASGGRVSAR